MFKFDFDLEDEDEEIKESFGSLNIKDSQEIRVSQDPFKEISLSQLIESLPQTISFSPISIPSSSGQNLTLSRRDLFDARFQLIADGKLGDASEAEEQESTAVDSNAFGFIDAPSDLVPGKYEGGFKTWEASVDLVEYLSTLKDHRVRAGHRILEIGCGTAIPSMYLLHKIFASSKKLSPEIHVHLQDYNATVLELITLPNVILAWYMSPASSSYRNCFSESFEDDVVAPPPDPSSPGELTLTSALTTAFTSSLESIGISLKFFSGSWETFDVTRVGGRYHTVLTSETIYRNESLPALLNLLHSSCVGTPLENVTTSQTPTSSPYLCLVAAKVLYFGVGGSISDFIKAVEDKGGKVTSVWEYNAGVGRKVMRIDWLRE